MNTTITDSGTENKIWKYLLISMISIFCAGTVSPNQSHLPDVAGDSLLLLRIHVASGNTTKCHRLRCIGNEDFRNGNFENVT